MTILEKILVTVATLALCMLFAHIICHLKSYDFSSRAKHRYGSIDGLRGYLALGVLFHHFAITMHWKLDGRWDTPPEALLNTLGPTGVCIFFIITGFLFTRKILDEGHVMNWKKLYISRVFRIMPLYLFVVALITAIVAIEADFKMYTSATNILISIAKWLVYSGGQINGYRYTSLIIAAVDWTLRYEWLFYLSLPLLSLAITRSRPVTIIVGLTALICSLYTYTFSLAIWKFNSFFIIFFLIGGLVAKLSKDFNIDKRSINHPVITLIATACLAIQIKDFPSPYGFPQAMLLATFFTPIALGNDLFGLLKTNFSVFLGEISYSIYLMHGIVLYVLFSMMFPTFISSSSQQKYFYLMPLVAITVISVSWLTHSFIERPMIHLGRNLNQRQSVQRRL